MKTIRFFSIMVTIVFILAACGSESEPVLKLTLPADTPKATIERVQTAVPAMEKHLPGLFKYQSSMTFLEVRSSYPYFSAPNSGLPEESAVTWLAFKVSDDDDSIPGDYYARGHRIEIGIADSGKALILQKRQSKAVFIDRPFPPSEGDLVIPIH